MTSNQSQAQVEKSDARESISNVKSTGTTTTRRELWAFYLFYVGNSGLSGFNFGPSQYQNLLFLAGYDPTVEPAFSAPCGDNGCVLPYMGKVRDSWSTLSTPARSFVNVPLFSQSILLCC
jgi:hypothetical protein